MPVYKGVRGRVRRANSIVNGEHVKGCALFYLGKVLPNCKLYQIAFFDTL